MPAGPSRRPPPAGLLPRAIHFVLRKAPPPSLHRPQEPCASVLGPGWSVHASPPTCPAAGRARARRAGRRAPHRRAAPSGPHGVGRTAASITHAARAASRRMRIRSLRLFLRLAKRPTAATVTCLPVPLSAPSTPLHPPSAPLRPPSTPSPPAPAGLPHLVDVPAAPGSRLFGFEQRVPIPPYLLALAVGELESRELSPRSRWAGPL